MASVFQDCFRRIFSYSGGTGDPGPDPGGPTDPDDCVDPNDPECCPDENNPICDDGGGGGSDACDDPVRLTSCGDYCNANACCEGATTTITIRKSDLLPPAQGGTGIEGDTTIESCESPLPSCITYGGVKYSLGPNCTALCCPSQTCEYSECVLSDGNGCSNIETFECCEPATPSQGGAGGPHIPADEECKPPSDFGANFFIDEETCIASQTCINEAACVYYKCTASEQTSLGTPCISDPIPIQTLITQTGIESTNCADFPDEITIGDINYFKNKGDCDGSFPCCPIPVVFRCEPDSSDSPSTACGNCQSIPQQGNCLSVTSTDFPFSDLDECEINCPDKELVYVCETPSTTSTPECQSDTICTADDPGGEGVTWFRDPTDCAVNSNGGVGCCTPGTYWYCPIEGEGQGNVECLEATDDDCIPNSGPNVYQTKEACEQSKFTFCCRPEGSLPLNYSNEDCGTLGDGACYQGEFCITPDTEGVHFSSVADCALATPECSDCYDADLVAPFDEYISGLLSPDEGTNFQAFYCDTQISPRTQTISPRSQLPNNLVDTDANGNVSYDFLHNQFSLSINGQSTPMGFDGTFASWDVQINIDGSPTVLNYVFTDQCGNTVSQFTVQYDSINCTSSPAAIQTCRNLNGLDDHPFNYPCVREITATGIDFDFDDPGSATGVDLGSDGGDGGGNTGGGGSNVTVSPIDGGALQPGNNEPFSQNNRQGIEYLKSLNEAYTDKKLIDVIATNKRVTSGRSKFVPMLNDKHLHVLSNQVHASIWAIINIGKEPYATERAFDDIRLDYIYRSLDKELKSNIDRLIDYEGVSLKKKILSRIKRFLIAGRLDDFDSVGIRSLASEHEDILRSNTVSRENDLVDLINKKSKPLDYNYYGGLTKERMRLWKTLSVDLEKAIPYVDSNSELNFIDVKLDDSYEILDSSGESSTKYINEGDFITFYKSSGDRGYLDLDSLLDKAVMLDFEDARNAFALLNEDYGTTLTATSEETDLVEENYSLSDAREPFYFLKLEASTVEDLDRTNPLIRKTQATFKYVTDEDEINEWIEYKPWPYLHFYIESSDPLIDHMLNSEEVVAEFKDISFDKLRGYSEDIPVLPRRMPWYIIVVPTDRTRYLIGSGRSKLVAYNSRKATFRTSPSKKEMSQRWDSEIYDEKEAGFFEGVDPRVEQNTVKVAFNKTKLRSVKKLYRSGNEPLPRKPSSARRLFEAIRSAKDDDKNFIDSDKTTLEWASVFKGMTPNERRDIFNDFEKFSEKKDRIATNTFAKSETVRDRFVKITDVIDKNLTDLNDYDPPGVRSRRKAVKIDDEFEPETPEPLP